MKFNKIIFVGLVFFIAWHANVSAQTITALNPNSPVIITTIPNSMGPAGTTGAGGYDFFHANPNNTNNGGAADPTTNLSSLPSYVSNLTFDSSLLQYNSNSSMTIGATTYGEGLFYSPNYLVSQASPQTFLTFELTDGVPSTFDLGVLQNYPDNSQYTLSLYSGAPSPDTLLSSTAINAVADSTYANHFFYGEISGASAGDYIVISGAPLGGPNQVTIGGITFDTVPEPSSYALLGLGLALLLGVQRIRRTNSVR